jgi:hypothetical protein
MSHGASFLKKVDEFVTHISLFISAGVVEPLEKMWLRVQSGAPATGKSELAEKAVGVALPPAIR